MNDNHGKDLPVGNRPMPAFGGVSGAKGDLQRAKEAGKDYDPTPFSREPRMASQTTQHGPDGLIATLINCKGSAWTHHFLNQKPWHPMNFKNRMRTWENEQRTIKEHKDKERAQAEFDAEQEYRKTLSFLSEEQMQQHMARQSVSFMYQKPPGYDAAMARDKEAMERKALEAKNPPGEASDQKGQRIHLTLEAQPPANGLGSLGPTPGSHRGRPSADVTVRDKVLLDPFKNMLQARAALLNDNKLVMRSFEPSSSYGGIDPGHENQKLILDQDDHDPRGSAREAEGLTSSVGGGGTTGGELESLLGGLNKKERRRVLKRLREAREKEEWEEKVRRAEEVLREAGYQANG